MAELHDMTGQNRAMNDLLALTAHGKAPHDGGGGGDMLEARVARLEEDMKEVRADLKALRADAAELKGKVSMLPGWGGLLTAIGFIVAAVGLMIRFMPPAGTP